MLARRGEVRGREALGAEAAVGWVDRELLERVAKTTGGAVIEEGATVPADQASFTRTVELSPWLLHLLLALFAVELLVRRWENALGVRDTFEDLFGATPSDA